MLWHPMKSVITGSGIGIPERNVVPNEKSSPASWTRRTNGSGTRSGIEQTSLRPIPASRRQTSASLPPRGRAMKAAGRTRDDIDAFDFRHDDARPFLPGKRPRWSRRRWAFREVVCRPSISASSAPDFFTVSNLCRLADPQAESTHASCSSVATCTRRSCRGRNGWDTTIGLEDREVTAEEREANTRHSRSGWCSFGDGGGRGSSVEGDGRWRSRVPDFEALHEWLETSKRSTREGSGFPPSSVRGRTRQIDEGDIIPDMDGRESLPAGAFRRCRSR